MPFKRIDETRYELVERFSATAICEMRFEWSDGEVTVGDLIFDELATRFALEMGKALPQQFDGGRPDAENHPGYSFNMQADGDAIVYKFVIAVLKTGW